MELVLIGLALALGLKHAFDADHVVAIGNVLTRARSVVQATRLSLYWSLGHMLTAGLITALLYFGRETVWPGLIARLDILVPVMLVAIGVLGLLLAARRLHAHRHAHGDRSHTHLHVHLNEGREGRRLGAIGLVHGVASNDELLLVLTATLGASSLSAALLLVGVFSLGVVSGMVLYAAALQFFFSVERRPTAGSWANVALSVASLGYGAFLLSGWA